MKLRNWSESTFVLFERVTLVKRAFVSEFTRLSQKNESCCSESVD